MVTKEILMKRYSFQGIVESRLWKNEMSLIKEGVQKCSEEHTGSIFT